LFKLEIQVRTGGHHIIRTEAGIEVEDCILNIPITTFEAIWYFMAELESNISLDNFKIIHKKKNAYEYLLEYEAI
jgi:hypothetical protein